MKFLFAFVLLICATVHAQVIPTNRAAAWQFAGVPGGIPNRTTIFVNVLTTANVSYKCVGNGITDDSGQIANAMNACPSNQVVYLPTATYCFSNRVYCASLNGVSLRGDGPGLTILKDSCTNCGTLFTLGQVGGIGNGADNLLPGSNFMNLASGYTQGSSNLVCSNSQLGFNGSGVSFNVGDLMMLTESNEPYVTPTGQNGTQTFSSPTSDGQHCLNQMMVITAINNVTNLTVWPPVAWTYRSALNPILYLQNFSHYVTPTVCKQVGFENLTITNAVGSLHPKQEIDWWTCVQCWMTNVEIVNCDNYGFFMDSGLQNQIDHCNFHATALTNIYYQMYDMEMEFSSFVLIQNNIINGFFEGIQVDSGGCGNVVAYNVFTNYYNAGANGDDTNRCAPGLSTSHGAFPMLNLIEGNYGAQFQRDAYWGSSGFDTLFRNIFTGVDAHGGILYTNDLICLKIDNASTSNNVVGNILGNPNTVWTQYLMTGQAAYSDLVINRFGYPGIDSDGYTGTNAGPNSLDTTVQSSMIYVQNYDYFNNAIQNPTNATLPASLYLPSKPAWWGGALPWPPFDPSSVTAAATSVTNIPAGYRYVFGVDPPSGAPATPNNLVIFR